MSTSLYDPKRMAAIFGVLPLVGYADGEMIAVNMQGDGASATVGTQGEAVLIENHNFSAEVTHRFSISTIRARIVVAQLAAHKKNKNIALPYVLTHLDTGETVAAGLAKIKNYPNANFSDAAPVREVMFVLGEVDYSVNPVVTPPLFGGVIT